MIFIMVKDQHILTSMELPVHPSSGPTSARQSLTAIRIAAAILMIIHGVYRATHEGYVSGFGGFLESKGFPDDRARLLKALNAQIDVRDLRVGPSYFMRSEASTEAGLAQIWDYDILPLLVEHLYGTKDAAEVATEFGLAAMQQEIMAVKADAPTPGPADFESGLPEAP